MNYEDTLIRLKVAQRAGICHTASIKADRKDAALTKQLAEEHAQVVPHQQDHAYTATLGIEGTNLDEIFNWYYGERS